MIAAGDSILLPDFTSSVTINPRLTAPLISPLLVRCGSQANAGVSAVILLGLLAAAITLGAIGIYHVTSGDRPTIQYGILLLILIGALMIWDQAGSSQIPRCVMVSRLTRLVGWHINAKFAT